jgi:hypothetical protein
LTEAGYLARVRGDHGAARSLLSESVALSRRLGDAVGLAWALIMSATVPSSYDIAHRRTLLDQAASLMRQADDEPGLLWALVFLSIEKSSI